MSLLFDGDTCRTDLGAGAPTLSALSVVMWVDPASALERKGYLALTADTADALPTFYFRNVDGNHQVNASNTSNVDQPLNNDVSALTTGWQLLIYRHDDATDTQKMRRNGASDKVSAGSFALPYPGGGAPAQRILTMGRWTAGDSTYMINNVHRAAHIALYNRYLSDAECAFLWNGGTAGAGGNPMSVSGAAPFAYWRGDSLTALVGGFTLASLDGTMTIDGASNPNVDAPPSGSSIALTGQFVSAAAGTPRAAFAIGL